MKSGIQKFLMIIVVQLIAVASLYAQGKVYEGPDDPAGDIQAIREGYMTGNRILLYFQNTTELAKWTETYRGSQWSRWPNDYSGVRMLDGIALLIGARVFLKNDTIPVDDINQVYTTPGVDTLWYLQTSYREEMDTDPTGTIEWGLYPVYGYFNEFNEYPAMSNLPQSWPLAGWPSSGTSLKWPGEWNGRFGRGQFRADLETFFVANDAQDQEYLTPINRVKYYPRPGVKIGDRRPDVTIQKGAPWGGIGVRVEQRGFQWNNPQARDAIFWEYNIANISDYNLTEVAFGYWVDNGIGGEADDELGYFDTYIDMAYSWDIDGIGAGGLKTGVMGFAYLESPGLGYDGIDNDQDGLIDEKRDNPAGALIGATDGIADLEKFLRFYKLNLEDLREHFEGDEDQDWQDGFDANGNGVYAINVGTEEDPLWILEPGESAGDDVGLDGTGPNDLNYTGPDEGEGNHRPDYVQGVGCEPNFNFTDVTESDMIGLTSFRLFPIPPHRPPYNRWFRNDKSMWELIGTDSTLEFLGNISNLVECFASGPFPLYQGREERISMAMIHSYDDLAGLNSDAHTAPTLYKKKGIVQVIYEKDYQFAQPPLMPTLSATAGDGKVILTWDDVADTKTRDPFLGNINDFEGYKLYRATDKYMADAEVITDGFGNPLLKKPIFQCDLKNNIEGFATWGIDETGIAYWLGSETGIVHHFVDNTVQNGRTYYYALVAYDFGAPDIGPGISPSENTITIELDEFEEVRMIENPDGSKIMAIGKNVAIVTPRTDALGYTPPTIEQNNETSTLGTGDIQVEILATNDLKRDHTYKINFLVDTVYNVRDYKNGLLYANKGLEVYDVTGDKPRLVYKENPGRFTYDNLIYRESTAYKYWTFVAGQSISTDVFEGMRLKMNFPVETAQFNATESGWVVGNAAMRVTLTRDESYYFPWDYDIIFSSDPAAHVNSVQSNRIRNENGTRLSVSSLLFGQSFNFYVQNRNFTDSTGQFERLEMVVQDMNNNKEFDILQDRILVGPVSDDNNWAGTAFIIDFQNISDINNLPKDGDFYRVTFHRPFWKTDSILFTIKPEATLSTEAIASSMDKIRVVPNPYIATNSMEPAISNPLLNQRRRIMFTHLPAECTIKIFTVSGLLVDEIEVNNPADNGMVHWDLQTREGLEVAAGIYIYHVKSARTGDEKMDKFAIIK